MSGRPGSTARAAARLQHRTSSIANAVTPGLTRRRPPLPYPSAGAPSRGRTGTPAGDSKKHPNTFRPRQVDITSRYVKVERSETRRSKAARARSDKAPYRIATARDVTTLSPNPPERGRGSCPRRSLARSAPRAEAALLRSLARAESPEHPKHPPAHPGRAGVIHQHRIMVRMSSLRDRKRGTGFRDGEAPSFSRGLFSCPRLLTQSRRYVSRLEVKKSGARVFRSGSDGEKKY